MMMHTAKRKLSDLHTCCTPELLAGALPFTHVLHWALGLMLLLTAAHLST